MTDYRKSEVLIRPFTPDDLEALLAIQKEAPTTAQWGSADYAHLAAHPGGLILVAESDGTVASPTARGGPHPTARRACDVIAFVALTQMADEAELRSIAVRPSHQRRGVGRKLMEEAHERLLQAGANRLFLEVRPSNTAALELYRSLGYRVRMERRKYYQDPPEDALVLGLELVPKEE